VASCRGLWMVLLMSCEWFACFVILSVIYNSINYPTTKLVSAPLFWRCTSAVVRHSIPLLCLLQTLRPITIYTLGHCHALLPRQTVCISCTAHYSYCSLASHFYGRYGLLAGDHLDRPQLSRYVRSRIGRFLGGLIPPSLHSGSAVACRDSMIKPACIRWRGHIVWVLSALLHKQIAAPLVLVLRQRDVLHAIKSTAVEGVENWGAAVVYLNHSIRLPSRSEYMCTDCITPVQFVNLVFMLNRTFPHECTVNKRLRVVSPFCVTVDQSVNMLGRLGSFNSYWRVLTTAVLCRVVFWCVVKQAQSIERYWRACSWCTTMCAQHVCVSAS